MLVFACNAHKYNSLFFIIPCLNCVIAKVKSHCNFVVPVEGCRTEVTTTEEITIMKRLQKPLIIPAQKKYDFLPGPVIVQNKPKIVQGKIDDCHAILHS